MRAVSICTVLLVLAVAGSPGSARLRGAATNGRKLLQDCTYTIKSGDTFWKVAEAGGFSVDAIQKANPGVDPTKLRVGQKINLPVPPNIPCSAMHPDNKPNSGGAPSAGLKGAANKGRQLLQDCTYTLKSGESFRDLAQARGFSIDAIQAANPGVDPTKLQAGQKINLPAAGCKKQGTADKPTSGDNPSNNPKGTSSSKDKVNTWTQLPVGPKLNSKFHSRYITLDASKGQKLFYVFGEAETNPESAPLIFWMNGGPGCSSVGLTFIKGNGPYIPVSNSTKLLPNKNSFTKFANVIWLEQPLFTGFSTSKDEADRNTDDTKTSKDMLQALLKWYDLFPQYRNNRLFLAGQSYAGHYGPLFAKRILDYNNAATSKVAQESGKRQVINLRGLSMGNAWTDPYYDNTATLRFWHDNNLISKDVYEALSKCDMKTGALWRTDGPSGFNAECEKARDAALTQIGKINQYGINAPMCVGKDAKYPAPDYETSGWQMFDPCAAKVLDEVMDSRDVQLAFGAIEPSEATINWDDCAGKGINYSLKDMMTSMIPVYKELVSRGLPVLFMNGETDAYVPASGSRAWIESMNLPLLDANVPIRQWQDTNTGQIGGSVVEYKGFTRVAVSKAGHSLASWAPYKNSQVVRTFVEGGRLPSYVPKSKGKKDRR